MGSSGLIDVSNSLCLHNCNTHPHRKVEKPPQSVRTVWVSTHPLDQKEEKNFHSSILKLFTPKFVCIQPTILTRDVMLINKQKLFFS